MRRIAVEGGHVAVVDDADYERVAHFRWYASRHGRTIYAICHETSGRGGRRVLRKLHRLVLQARRGVRVDHRDGDGLNCTRANLRIATHAQNMANTRKRRNAVSSNYKGVSWDRDARRWRAQIQAHRKPRAVGRFRNEQQAARAYDAAARAAFGSFAVLNFPRRGERSALTGRIRR